MAKMKGTIPPIGLLIRLVDTFQLCLTISLALSFSMTMSGSFFANICVSHTGNFKDSLHGTHIITLEDIHQVSHTIS